MSVNCTAWAWKNAPRAPNANCLLVLLKLADMARDSGKAWPSHAYLAHQVHLSPRTVRSAVSALEDSGLLRTEARDGKSDVIWLVLTPTVLFDSVPDDAEFEGGIGRGRPKKTPAPNAKTSANPARTPARGADEPSKEARHNHEEANASSAARGTRLPEGWEPDPEIANVIGLSELDSTDQLSRFRDYWIAQPGAKGRKVDWTATWRNWCRNALERRNGRGSPATRTAPIDRGAEQHASRVDSLTRGAQKTADRWRGFSFVGSADRD